MAVRRDEDGTMLADADTVDDAPENQPAAIAQRTADAIREALEGAGAVAPEFAYIGQRPMPFDGVPVTGYLPNVKGVYVCAMHPGVVLAAIVGQLASGEIVDGLPASALEACRPAHLTVQALLLMPWRAVRLDSIVSTIMHSTCHCCCASMSRHAPLKGAVAVFMCVRVHSNVR